MGGAGTLYETHTPSVLSLAEMDSGDTASDWSRGIALPEKWPLIGREIAGGDRSDVKPSASSLASVSSHSTMVSAFTSCERNSLNSSLFGRASASLIG